MLELLLRQLGMDRVVCESPLNEWVQHMHMIMWDVYRVAKGLFDEGVVDMDFNNSLIKTLRE